MPSVRLPAGDHQRRATKHCDVGDALRTAAANEWAAVCYFYSAYHLVRDRLTTDPVFADASRLKVFSRHLTPDDRDTERHHGSRAPGFGWGVNELVRMLYPSISGAYEYVHQASIQVRYDNGLRYPLDRVKASLDLIRTALTGGLAA